HDNEIINLIVDNCINCYNRDNSKFDVLRAITSLISDLQQLYPSHVTKFLISTSILSHAGEKINYAPNSHLDGSIDELPESALSKTFKSIYGHIYDFIEAINIGMVGSYVGVNLGLFIVILLGNQTNTLELFVMVVTFLAAGLTIFIMLWVSIVDALHDRRSYYPAVKLLIPLPKFASYPAKYNFLFELLKPTPNEFIKTALQIQIPIIYSDWNGEALLNFKWNRFGRFYYYVIWMVYTIFLLAFTLATSLPNNYISLEKQRALLIFSITMGFSQLTIEIRQFIWDWRSYIVSSWNWFDLGAYLFPIITSFLRLSNITIPAWLLAISCVAKSVFSFLVILAFFVFAYAHAFYILLHPANKFDPSMPDFNNDSNNPWNLATTYNPINNGNVIMSPSLILLPNANTNLYEFFGTALLAVYKLMTGDTSSLANWEYYNNKTLVFLWISFSLFTVIYLLNLFIGLLNVAIAENNSRVLFLIQRAEILAEIELFYLLPHQRRWESWFPDRILYYAHVDKLRNKLYNINDVYKESRYQPNIQNHLLKLLHMETNIIDEPDDIFKINKSTQTDN
ncbi:14079_t:CDS:2, partial [Dentiscutata heterogama]